MTMDPKTLDYSWLGAPFCATVPTGSTLVMASLDYAWLGAPFVTNLTGVTLTVGHPTMKRFGGVPHVGINSGIGIRSW